MATPYEAGSDASRFFYDFRSGQKADVSLEPRAGQFTRAYHEVLQPFREALDEIAPGAPDSLLFPSTYIPRGAYDELWDIVEWSHQVLGQLRVLRYQRSERLVEFGRELAEEEANQAAVYGLAEAPYNAMSKIEPDIDISRTDCSLAATIMPYNAITGLAADTERVRPMLWDWYKTHEFSDEQLGKTFYGASFTADDAPAEVRVVPFYGCSTEQLGRLVEVVHGRDESADVYCITSVTSETIGAPPGAWHKMLVLEVEPPGGTAIVHDPAPGHGGPHRELPREEFVARWMAALGSGMLVISQPND